MAAWLPICHIKQRGNRLAIDKIGIFNRLGLPNRIFNRLGLFLIDWDF